MNRTVAAATTVLVGAAGVGPAAPQAAAARAAQQHTVLALADLYLPNEVSVAAGDSLVLHNLDNDVHDVIARDLDETGQPYFRSAAVTFNRTAVVRGVPALGPADYPFFCTVHADMTGVLVVR